MSRLSSCCSILADASIEPNTGRRSSSTSSASSSSTSSPSSSPPSSASQNWPPCSGCSPSSPSSFHRLPSASSACTTATGAAGGCWRSTCCRACSASSVRFPGLIRVPAHRRGAVDLGADRARLPARDVRVQPVRTRPARGQHRPPPGLGACPFRVQTDRDGRWATTAWPASSDGQEHIRKSAC